MTKEYIYSIDGERFIFNLQNKNIKIDCFCKSTRNGFKHYSDFIVIETLENNIAKEWIYALREEERKEIKVTYLNRTWERFTYQSLLYQCINWLYGKKYITKEEAEQLKKEIE